MSRTANCGSGFPSFSGNWGHGVVLGCHCSGWQEGAVGTLVWRGELHKELLALGLCIFHSQEASQTNEPDIPGLLTQLERVSISSQASNMAQTGDSAGIMDLKKNLRRMYELLAISVMDNKEMAKEVKSMSETVSYTSQQISNHDSRIDDNESNLREIMGKIDRIQEDLQSFMAMNQSSKAFGDTAEAVQPMEEESVAQPRRNRGNP